MPLIDQDQDAEDRALRAYLQMQTDIFIICRRHNGSVTGGPRTSQRNTQVGGHERSWHLWTRGGLGVDVMFDSEDQRTNGIAAFKRMDYEVIDHYRDGHVHVEPIG